MSALRIAVAAVALSFVFACGSSPDESSSSDVGQSESNLTGGCRLVCPKCHPGEVCPMIACVQDCHGRPTKCVETQLCPIGYTWSQSACSCIADPGTVSTQCTNENLTPDN